MPRCYLEGFTEEREPMLWIYRKGKGGIPRRSSPEEASRWSHYYSITTSAGKHDPVLETDFLGKIESAVAPLLVRFRQGELYLSDDDRGALAAFIACMDLRVPRQIEQRKEFAAEVHEHVLKLMAARPGYLEDVTRKIVLDGGIKVEMSHDFGLSMMPAGFEQIAGCLFEMRWTFVVPTGQSRFITSDAPVLLRAQKPRKGIFKGVGFGNEDAEVWFPLHRGLMLRCAYDGKEGWVEMPRDGVQRFNRWSASRATDEVYASDGTKATIQLVEEVWASQKDSAG